MRKGRRLFFITTILFTYLGFAFGEQDLTYDLDPIVITKSNNGAMNLYSLESSFLEGLPFNSPLEALTLKPLDLQSRSPKADIQADFSLRGSTFQGVLILIDGRRVNDPQTGHHNSDIPLTKEDIERIQVIPGLLSCLFGPDAIGGAINIVLKKPQERKKTFEFGFGSHRTKSNIFSITEKINNLGFRFSLERQESDGFGYDTDFKKFTTALNSSIDITDGELDIGLGYQEKEFGAYDFYTPASGYPSKEWTKTFLLSTGLNLEKYGFIIKPTFLWRRHYDKFMLDKTHIRSVYLNHHRTDMYTPNIYFQKEAGVLGIVGLGLGYGKECINSTRLGKHSRNNKSIYVKNSKDLNSVLSLNLSARTDDYNESGQIYSGSLYLRYRFFKENSLYFGLSRSIRIPSFTELYYSDPTTVGDVGLSEEESLNYEVGFDHTKEGLLIKTAFFLREEKNFIDWIKATPAQPRWKAENITAAEVFGVENYLRFGISENLNFDSNYTYIDKRIDKGSYIYKYGTNYARHIVNAGFNFNLPFGIQTIALTYKKKPSRDGWFLLSSYFSYNLFHIRNEHPSRAKPSNEALVFLRITNLLNVEYQEIEGIPQPGRWIEAGVRLEW